MNLDTYVLSPTGACPDILLVSYGSLINPVEKTPVTASQGISANESYMVNGQTSTAIDLTLDPCTNPGDQILVSVMAGIAPIQVLDAAGAVVWSTPAPNPASTFVLRCNGTSWEVIE